MKMKLLEILTGEKRKRAGRSDHHLEIEISTPLFEIYFERGSSLKMISREGEIA